MEKITTFTLDKGNGEQNLIDLGMKNIAYELEAEAESFFKENPDEDSFEVTILIEKKMTREEVDNLPDYNG